MKNLSLDLSGRWHMAVRTEHFDAAIGRGESQGAAKRDDGTARPAKGASPAKETSAEEPGAKPPEALLRVAAAPEGEAGSVPDYHVRAVDVPTSWEAEGWPKGLEGPVWFTRTFSSDYQPENRSNSDGRLFLRFEAVSYFCTVWLNGRRLGEHRGMWDPFEFDVTGLLEEQNIIAVEVYKPWETFPVRESLAGFIPYVTSTFGGLWQSVSLVMRPSCYIDDAFCRMPEPGEYEGPEDRLLEVELRVISDGDYADATLRIDAGGTATERTVDLAAGENLLHVLSRVDRPVYWSVDDPRTTEVRCTLIAGTNEHERVITTGLRRTAVDGRRILWNGKAIYPRGILHWLSYPETVAPMPSEETIRHELESMRALGYNMVKLCLVIPSERYFELADELGMYLWVELPMWLPRITEELKGRAIAEYTAILRRIRNHPSILMYTLGCELSAEADEDFLRELYELVKDETRSPLVRDNSGSAEAYGGVDTEFADFHDYHFYAEAPAFTDLLDHFLPEWKPKKPLVFGEYNDSDTFRSITELKEELEVDELYWTENDPVKNPQGVRWDYNVVTNEERFAKLDLALPLEEIHRRSRAKSLEYRKDIIEQTRAHQSASGYVVTNIQDTPITTSGMLDDLGRSKFSADDFQLFNREDVILLRRGLRRTWLRGGDRRQFLSESVLSSGEPIGAYVLASLLGPLPQDYTLEWTIELNGRQVSAGEIVGAAVEQPSAEGSSHLAKILGRIEEDAPSVESPADLALRCVLRERGKSISENRFRFFLLPERSADDLRGRLYDPGTELSEYDRVTGLLPIHLAAERPNRDELLVATRMHPTVVEHIAEGGRAVLLFGSGESPLTEELPFFREAIPLVYEHPILDELPHEGYAAARFRDVTPDCALNLEELSNVAENLGLRVGSIVSRLDARQTTLTSYLAELQAEDGSPKAVCTTFKLAGGFGRAPLGLRRNILGRYLLGRAISYLKGAGG
jgi:hypothetical protein